MAGRASAATIQAMRYVLDAGMTPYKAAKRAEIALTTIYRSPIYKMWLAGDIEGARKQMNQTAPRQRGKKRERYAGTTLPTKS